ncbi:MAG: hypothetical protein MZW92_35560 [Comamonadaceae bacterium]|nr:hypothetical protein [Comamonadaceae bacterium]
MPGIKLNPVEGGTACQFATDPEGRGVYEDRPYRLPPLPGHALLTMRRSDEYVDRSAYALVTGGALPWPLSRTRSQTIEEYRRRTGCR